MADSYDVATELGRVRLLLNDVQEPFLFDNDEVRAFLDLEGGSVKAAAALAIETNADSILLASRVLRTQDVSTDGAKVQAALLSRAAMLREQADDEFTDDTAGDGLFAVVEAAPGRHPELTEFPVACWPPAW